MLVRSKVILKFDDIIGAYKLDKPIYDSDNMVEKYISINDTELSFCTEKFGKLPNPYENNTELDEIEIHDGFWIKVLMSYYFYCRTCQDSEGIPILIDKGDYYWLDYSTTVDMDYNTDFHEMSNDWQW
jgi:hypothetical protein